MKNLSKIILCIVICLFETISISTVYAADYSKVTLDSKTQTVSKQYYGTKKRFLIWDNLI